MDYFIFNLYFFATWILIAAGIIAIIIKLPTKADTNNETKALNICDVVASTWQFYYHWDEEKKIQFKIKAPSRDEAQQKAYDIYGAKIETMIFEIE